MHFRTVNPHNVRWFVPAWAVAPFALARQMEVSLTEYFQTRKVPHFEDVLKFWISVTVRENGCEFRVCEPVTEKEKCNCGMLFIEAPEWVINVPLNPMLKGAPSSEGTHSVYYHSFETLCPLAYIGITKRKWFERLAEHEASARGGSPYLFHRALREHSGKRRLHRVMLGDIDHDTAMQFEEEWVGAATLYPLGLNMIPGGFAGIRYLGSLGIRASSAKERDAAVERLSARESIEGRVNPLCAARWEADQDFVNRVICGHSGRLTVEQVRLVRMLSASGASSSDIASRVGGTVARVLRAIKGATYARVA